MPIISSADLRRVTGQDGPINEEYAAIAKAILEGRAASSATVEAAPQGEDQTPQGPSAPAP